MRAYSRAIRPSQDDALAIAPLGTPLCFLSTCRLARKSVAMIPRVQKNPARSPPTARLAPRLVSSMSSPGISFRVDFHDQCSIGIDQIRLLEAIGSAGSLSQAARDIGMSYRRAWLLIDGMNTDFDTAVVNARAGGRGGGGAQLTSFGEELIEAYRELEGLLAILTLKHMSEIAARVTGRSARP
jgi:molybdate transport system regulatory protein